MVRGAGLRTGGEDSGEDPVRTEVTGSMHRDGLEMGMRGGIREMEAGEPKTVAEEGR
jgi:hypothetical protein